MNIPPLGNGEFQATYTWDLHPDSQLIHVGWRALVGCEWPDRDQQFVPIVAASEIQGKDLSLLQLISLLAQLDTMLQAAKMGALHVNSKIQEGAIWIRYEMVFPHSQEPKNGWWLGFGDAAFMSDRMQMDAWWLAGTKTVEAIQTHGWPVDEQHTEDVPELYRQAFEGD